MSRAGAAARPWRIGLVPLVDAALLIAMVEKGFAAAAGVAVELVPQPSWATLRDELALGHLDAAHMLAPLAVAVRLGLSGPRVDLVAAASLGLNGNAVTVSLDLWAEMEAEGAAAGADLAATARAFVAAAGRRAAAGRPLVLGTVFPFSCHTYQLRAFARLGGGDLDALARLVVVPPPRTAAALGEGRIDGFCVGSPWNSVAVAAGTGRIAALGCEIAPDCPEKVLALSADSRARAAPLLTALAAAAAWCADPAHRGALARLLAEPRHLGVPAELIARTLEGRLALDAAGAEATSPRYVVLGGGPPSVAQADWLAAAMAEAGQAAIAEARAAAHDVYRA